MNDVAIKVEGLGKAYLVGHQSRTPERYTALRDVLARNVRNLVRKTRDMMHGLPIIQGDEVEEFWALKDVSFELKKGETLGIIGRNGAGKSTLLKILSRITEPTTGRVTLNGRVASLLEVGTGFHPELTGRENIFLNGAILGMTRAEIRRKFDEIVDFAGVDKFLDTPVKRYSSGMYVRLAFSVAAHLEPEILVVDEVLAVGDTEFQKKCLGKMQDVATGGRTVLFVSHNMAAIQALCSRALLLSNGQNVTEGQTPSVVERYLDRFGHVTSQLHDLSAVIRKGNGNLRFKSVTFCDVKGNRLQRPATGQACTILLEVTGTQAERGRARVGIGLHDDSERPLILLANEVVPGGDIKIGAGDVLEVRLDDFPLFPGAYILHLFLEVAGQIEDWITDHLWIEVEDGPFFGTGRNAPIGWEGKTVLVKSTWRIANQAKDFEAAQGCLSQHR